MPPSNPTATATRKSDRGRHEGLQALIRIGSRHCHPDAKIADGAGRMNCSIAKARTTISQIAKMPTMTNHGRMWRSVFAAAGTACAAVPAECHRECRS